jgi:radical S-adenosyl methionine domain-containing protein 2
MIGNKIVLSGLAGSGKSTVGKLIANELSYEFVSMGEFTRKYASENFNMNINQFQDYCASNPLMDELLDEQFISFCNSKHNLIIDYRLGFHLLSNVYSVLLLVSDQEASKRINQSGRQYEDHDSIKIRNEQMLRRFQTKYNVNFIDPSNYHLNLITDKLSPNEISKIIINNHKSSKQKSL